MMCWRNCSHDGNTLGNTSSVPLEQAPSNALGYDSQPVQYRFFQTYQDPPSLTLSVCTQADVTGNRVLRSMYWV